MPFSLSDYVQPDNDVTRKVYKLQLENRSSYLGYNIWGEVGVEYDRVEMVSRFRTIENYNATKSFCRIFLGG